MSKGDKSDLTRLEDLGQFDHQDDPEIDLILTPEKNKAVSLDELNEETNEQITISSDQKESSEDLTSELSTAFKSDDDRSSLLEPLPDPLSKEEDSSPEFQNTDELSFTTPEAPSPPEIPLDENETTTFSAPTDAQEPTSDEIQFNQNEDPPIETKSNLEMPEEYDSISSPIFPTQPPSPPRRKPEDFQDIKSFAQSISYGKVSIGGNPPYSIVLKDIRFQEDAQEIFSILEEHDLVTPDTQEAIKQGIQHGAVLISQISEYSAIYLAHRLRRFDMEIMVGLSEELHHSKNYENEHRGLVSRENIKQNHTEHLNLNENPISLDNIILATTPTLEGYHINRYIEILTEHALLDEADFMAANSNLIETQIYDELVQRMKNRAFKLKCNGILGVNFQFIPLSSPNSQTRYKVICTGNAVMLSDK